MTLGSDAYSNNRNVNLRRSWGPAGRVAVAGASALFSGLLSFTTGYTQATSKGHLPQYMMVPAVIAAISAAVFACTCILGFFILHKYNRYHERHANERAEALKHKTHPIENGPIYLIFGSGAATVVFVLSYYYMLVCISKEKEDGQSKYCTVNWQSVKKDEDPCSSIPLITGGFLILLVLVFGWLYERSMQEAIDYFGNRRELHAGGLLGGGGSPPSYGDSSYGGNNNNYGKGDSSWRDDAW